MSSAAPVALPFRDIATRLKSTLRSAVNSGELAELDAVVALARGGVVAGALAAYELGLPLRLLQLSLRADDNVPKWSEPVALGPVPDLRGQRILIVDDVSVSGATLNAAKALLVGATARTLVLKGRAGAADYVLFDDVPQCVRWPYLEDHGEQLSDMEGAA